MWSSEETFTTGDGASENQEGYEEQFAVPGVAPHGGDAKDHGLRRGPTGPKPEKAEDRQPSPIKAIAKRKSLKKKKKKKKKKLRAPDSADESLSKPQSKDTGRKYTAAEMRHVLAHTGLFRLLERDPILSFIKPKLMSEFTGPFLAPDFDSLTSVMRAAPTFFEMLRESVFGLGALEVEKVYDWDREVWTRTIQDMLEPLTVLAGSVEREGTPSVMDPAPASSTTPSPPPRYQSSVDSDSRLKSPMRMSMNRPPRVMQLADVPARAAPSTTSAEAIPKTLEDAIIRIMRTTAMRTPSPHASAAPSELPPPTRPAPTTVPHPEVVDVAMKSVSSHSTSESESRRDVDDNPDDLFDLDIGTHGNAAAVSTATTGPGITRVRLSASSELKEFQGRDASEEEARVWLNRLKSAARRDRMTGEEVCGLFSDLMNGHARQCIV
ncbi:Eukaryotic/viral aspartic protease [Phytophthora cinnamomi]|uniref:Eukaryotic/viral aspartic protease n=1 Tax=Phytophthora cinnamomi TaxID=4785 RepID=UPI00355984FB|nr:Eukaryotic/viral aspartic protease [Phytophthora cinnamomi]